MITQCPIPPGKTFTYKFKVIKQEGTLWWHAHVSVLRATVYGALIIQPRSPKSFPFPKPDHQVPILLGEWWNADIIQLENEALAVGGGPNNSDAYTINGLPGDLYPCSQNRKYISSYPSYIYIYIYPFEFNQLFKYFVIIVRYFQA